MRESGNRVARRVTRVQDISVEPAAGALGVAVLAPAYAHAAAATVDDVQEARVIALAQRLRF